MAWWETLLTSLASALGMDTIEEVSNSKSLVGLVLTEEPIILLKVCSDKLKKLSALQLQLVAKLQVGFSRLCKE